MKGAVELYHLVQMVQTIYGSTCVVDNNKTIYFLACVKQTNVVSRVTRGG